MVYMLRAPFGPKPLR